MQSFANLSSPHSRLRFPATPLVALALLTLALTACGGGDSGRSDSAESATVLPAVPPAPHGGMLVSVGAGRAHLEFVVDSVKGVVTAYVLDRDAKTPLRLKQGRIDLTMLDLVEGVPEVYTVLAGKANPRTNETGDDTSVFIGFVPQLVGRPEFRAKVQRVEIGDEVFSDIPLTFPPSARV